MSDANDAARAGSKGEGQASWGPLRRGEVVDGRYEILSHIGLGGFAQVYRARHIRTGGEVAVKVLDVAQAGTRRDEVEARFLVEARATASLLHPNVVRVHDFGRVGEPGPPYIAMELLEGHDLQVEIIRRGRLSPSRALWLIKPALSALGEAHRQGIVHKDLKPDNLFLRRPGSAVESLVVTDFGIARLKGGSRRTRTGHVLGTPQYLAPEYIESQIAVPQTDVYQMGLILIEMLTGAPVLNAVDPLHCMHRHCSGNLDLPGWLMSSPLGPALRTATALDYRRRHADGHAFRAALEAIDEHTLQRLSALWDKGKGYTPTLVDEEASHRPGARGDATASWRRASVGVSLAGLAAMAAASLLWGIGPVTPARALIRPVAPIGASEASPSLALAPPVAAPPLDVAVDAQEEGAAAPVGSIRGVAAGGAALASALDRLPTPSPLSITLPQLPEPVEQPRGSEAARVSRDRVRVAPAIVAARPSPWLEEEPAGAAKGDAPESAALPVQAPESALMTIGRPR